MVNSPARFGKPRSADKALRQSKMEDFKSISRARPGAGQPCQEPVHASSSAAVSDIRHDNREPSESDLNAAITEQLIIQQDEVLVPSYFQDASLLPGSMSIPVISMGTLIHCMQQHSILLAACQYNVSASACTQLNT